MSAWAARFRSSLENLTPEQVALLVSVGVVLGVFPITGLPTVFCVLAAGRLRLNPVAMQLLNNAASPLQLALILPLARAGAWLCGGGVGRGFGTAAIHAIAGWACMCVPAGVLLYAIILVVMRRGRAACFNDIKSPA